MLKSNQSIILFFYFLSSFTVLSQTKAEQNFGSWYMYHGNHNLKKGWGLTSGLQERNYNTFRNYNLFLIYAGVNYKISKSLTANITYGYLDIDRTFDPDVEPNTIEHRIFEQISYKTLYFKLPFSHRLRLEHRNLYTSGNYRLINRIRYRLKFIIPLNKKFYTNISNESFFNFKGEFYPENRFYAALGFKVNKNISLEAGYLNQYINFQNLDRLQVGVFLKTGQK